MFTIFSCQEIVAIIDICLSLNMANVNLFIHIRYRIDSGDLRRLLYMGR